MALAFAAQKTLENVFGGIFVLSDRSIVVGDVCQIGKYAGEVEDVGLRSMQLRTLNRTVVYVPNGTLATMEVENLSRRDKFLFNPTVGLRYETTLEQLQRVVERHRGEPGRRRADRGLDAARAARPLRRLLARRRGVRVHEGAGLRGVPRACRKSC